MARLAEEEGNGVEVTDTEDERQETALEKPISLNSVVLDAETSTCGQVLCAYPTLNQRRLETVTATLKNYDVKRVIDLGCGEGKLLQCLLKEPAIEKITGLDVSYRVLEIASKRLRLDELPIHQQKKIQLIQGSLMYRDRRLAGYDAATLIEVVEHLDLDRLATLERVVFEFARPKLVIVTTPNIEYNVRFDLVGGNAAASAAYSTPSVSPPDKLRHRDHRFEWTQQEFQDWANRAAQKFDYQVELSGIGDVDPEVGAPTSMGVFTMNQLGVTSNKQ